MFNINGLDNQIAENENEKSINTTSDLKKNIMDLNIVLDSLKRFKSSDVGLLLNKDLEDEYQREFKDATTLKDANEVKAHIDRMKGIGFAMGVIGNLIIRVEDDLKNMRENLKYAEAGE